MRWIKWTKFAHTPWKIDISPSIVISLLFVCLNNYLVDCGHLRELFPNCKLKPISYQLTNLSCICSIYFLLQRFVAMQLSPLVLLKLANKKKKEMLSFCFLPNKWNFTRVKFSLLEQEGQQSDFNLIREECILAEILD